MVWLQVNVAEQRLYVYDDDKLLQNYPIGTAKKGCGEQQGSEQTPRGWHEITEIIGVDAPLNTVFVGRKPTGEIYTPALAAQFPERDWILTRIFWLSGLEPGKNQGGEVDTHARYIYIHGSPDAQLQQAPASHGCINMYSDDIIQLEKYIVVGVRVQIVLK